jgi:hypothetical protein
LAEPGAIRRRLVDPGESWVAKQPDSLPPLPALPLGLLCTAIVATL